MSESTNNEQTFVSSPPVVNRLRAIQDQLFAAFGCDWEEKTDLLKMIEDKFGRPLARDMWWLGHQVGLCAKTVKRVEFLLGRHATEIDGEWIRYQEKEEV